MYLPLPLLPSLCPCIFLFPSFHHCGAHAGPRQRKQRRSARRVPMPRRPFAARAATSTISSPPHSCISACQSPTPAASRTSPEGTAAAAAAATGTATAAGRAVAAPSEGAAAAAAASVAAAGRATIVAARSGISATAAAPLVSSTRWHWRCWGWGWTTGNAAAPPLGRANRVAPSHGWFVLRV